MSRRLSRPDIDVPDGRGSTREPSADCAQCGQPFTRTHGNQKFCVTCRDVELRRRGLPKDERLRRHALKMREEAKDARARQSGDILRTYWANLTEDERLVCARSGAIAKAAGR